MIFSHFFVENFNDNVKKERKIYENHLKNNQKLHKTNTQDNKKKS